MKRAIVFGGVLAIAAGVWVWRSSAEGQVCDRFQTTITEATGDSGGYATVRDALAAFRPPIPLPHASLVPTDEESPEFGATVNRRSPRGPEHYTEYYIWNDGVVVQSVSLHRYSGHWWIGAYSGCSEPGSRFK